jgi:ABC-type nitrate/sulfonate/bicarbonate transport system permease component
VAATESCANRRPGDAYPWQDSLRLTRARIGANNNLHRIVAVELLAATSGLGFMIMQAGDYLDTALVFAGIITIAVTGLILDGCLRGLLVLADPSRRR